MGGDRAVPTDAHTLSNHAAGADPRARSDLRLRPDDGAGIDADAIPEPRRRMDQRVRGHAGLAEARLRSQRPRVEPRDDLGIGPVRLSLARSDAGTERSSGRPPLHLAYAAVFG